MSSLASNLGTFDPNKYKNNDESSKPKSRMAGDYLSEFTSKIEDKEYKTNNVASFLGNSSNNLSKSSNTVSKSNNSTSTPAPSNNVSNPGGEGEQSQGFTAPGLKTSFSTQAEANAAGAKAQQENAAREASFARQDANRKPFSMQDFMMSQYGKWKQDNVSTDPNAPKL